MKRLLRPLLDRIRLFLLARPERVGLARPGFRRDEHLIEIQPGLALAVYWKVTDLGTGPAVIVQTDAIELMKFDCFGGDGGHFHIAPWYQARLAFLERTADEQITRALAEIRTNAAGYLHRHPRPEVAAIRLDPAALDTALARAEPLLRAHASRSAAVSTGAG
ncbi:MAG: hypothetical protein AAF081_04285 [Actinomycetota bacterium]